MRHDFIYRAFGRFWRGDEPGESRRLQQRFAARAVVTKHAPGKCVDVGNPARLRERLPL